VTHVDVRNGNVDGAIKRFRMKVQRDGDLPKAKKLREGYDKPGVVRRKAKQEAIKNARKRNKNY
jgi:ribosomal protein S21